MSLSNMLVVCIVVVMGSALLAGALAAPSINPDPDKTACLARGGAWACRVAAVRWHDGGVAQYESCECGD